MTEDTAKKIRELFKILISVPDQHTAEITRSEILAFVDGYTTAILEEKEEKSLTHPLAIK
jgi:hypothetical protein